MTGQRSSGKTMHDSLLGKLVLLDWASSTRFEAVTPAVTPVDAVLMEISYKLGGVSRSR